MVATYNTVGRLVSTMEQNVGTLDRNVRLALGVLLAVAGAVAVAGYLEIGLAVVAVVLVVGLVLLVTGATQTCPAYAGAGIDTTDAGD
jgi:uncharacterized membrane protein HdeD (DUF308 family)